MTYVLCEKVEAVCRQTKSCLALVASLTSTRGNLVKVERLWLVAFRTDKAYLKIHGTLR